MDSAYGNRYRWIALRKQQDNMEQIIQSLHLVANAPVYVKYSFPTSHYTSLYRWDYYSQVTVLRYSGKLFNGCWIYVLNNWFLPFVQYRRKVEFWAFLLLKKEVIWHEKDTLYRRIDRVCPETGWNWHSRGGPVQKDGDFWGYFLHLWTTSVLQVLNLVLGCCLHLSCIRKTSAKMGNPHTIASTTGRPLRPV